jgi:hypothetical protein
MPRWVLVLCVAALACGKGANTGGEKKLDIDADPLALLPGSAVVIANLASRAMFDSGPVGAEMAAAAVKLAPLGEQAGFDATHDVDRIALASYATGGIDVVVVLSGRFNESKIEAATTTTSGAPITRGTYAGRATHTAGAFEYSVLSPKTLVAGTGEGFRRLLERVQTGTLDRSMPGWMAETLETTGADVAVAADLETQPVAAAALGSMSLAWLKGMRIARAIGNFGPPGMNVAATLTYGDPDEAKAAVEGVHFVDGWLKMLGPLLGGVRLQNLEVTADAKDVRCKFAVDDHTLRTVLVLAPHFLPANP